MKKIIAASQNKKKIIEMETITKEFGMLIIPRDEAGIPEEIQVVEDGATFEENSYKKAKEIMDVSGEITIADDSGLEVDYLGGAPGVYSARFAGPGCTDEDNNNKLKELLEDIPFEKRTGRFVSVITMVYPDGRVISARGEVEGHILLKEQGEGGFGYDPLFQPLGYDISFGEFTQEAKNMISHRGKALRELKKLLSANSGI